MRGADWTDVLILAIGLITMWTIMLLKPERGDHRIAVLWCAAMTLLILFVIGAFAP